MPKLDKDALVEVKLDTAAGNLDNALTVIQKRGLFEKPGQVVYAIVELTSTSYTGHAEGEAKSPSVKLRVSKASVARDQDEALTLADAARAMYRRRRMDGTLDEVGPGPQDAGLVLADAFAGYPSEDEFQRHEKAKSARAREVERAANLR